MPEMSFGEDDFQESREAALAAAELARSPDAFKEAFEAFRTSDGERFRAALEPVGLLDRCRSLIELLEMKLIVARRSWSGNH